MQNIGYATTKTICKQRLFFQPLILFHKIFWSLTIGGLFRCYMVYVWIEDSPFQLKSEEVNTDFYHNERIIRDKLFTSGKLSVVFLFHVCSHSGMPSIMTSVLVILWFTQNYSNLFVCINGGHLSHYNHKFLFSWEII